MKKECPLEQDWLQVLELVFPFSMEVFYKTFFDTGASFGLEEFEKRQ